LVRAKINKRVAVTIRILSRIVSLCGSLIAIASVRRDTVLSNDYVVCIVYDQSRILLPPGILPKDWIFLPQCCYDGIHNTAS
jgi:hypothetical protein